MLGNQVTLRKITSADTENIVRWRNNPGVRERFMQQELFTKESHEEWLRTQVQTGHVAQFIIVENETGRDIGSTFLRDIDHTNNKAEIGAFIGEQIARGRGIGPEATIRTIEYGFRVLGLHRVYCRILSDNIVSMHSALKSGLVQEGYYHDYVRINGEYRDIMFFGIINNGKPLI